MLKHFKQYKTDTVFMKSSILVLVLEGILINNVHNGQAQIIFFHSHPEIYVEKFSLLGDNNHIVELGKTHKCFLHLFRSLFLTNNLNNAF